jgi:hypothetical protein
MSHPLRISARNKLAGTKKNFKKLKKIKKNIVRVSARNEFETERDKKKICSQWK